MKDNPISRTNCQIISCENLDELFKHVSGDEIPKTLKEIQEKQIKEIAFAFAEDNKRYYK